MRTSLLVIVHVGLASAAFGHDLGARAPVKAPPTIGVNVPTPERQGGDLIDTAVVIPQLPFDDTGTTAGYTDDYDEVCPYTQSTAPDVVYRYIPADAVDIDIDLCGSSYDTKLYVYDSNLGLVACNDDFYFDAPCGVYVSKLEDVGLAADQTYYVVIDGYGGEFGDYVLSIVGHLPCEILCPADGVHEGEPPLVDEYVDNYNGGCNTFGAPFQWIAADENGEQVFCGVSGWYLYQGSQYRDTDWYLLPMGFDHTIEITADAEHETFLFELGPRDCNIVEVVQTVTVGPCAPGTMAITGSYEMWEGVWFWVGPTVFAAPAGADAMYDYVLWISGLGPTLATESSSWSTVKALFR